MSVESGSCTCGNCIEGWLSPRMKERLEGEAEFLHFTASDLATDIDNSILEDGGVLPEVVIAADVSLHYIPMDLHPKMTPAFYHGYIVALQVILEILLHEPSSSDKGDEDHTSCIPTIPTITERLSKIQAAASEKSKSTSQPDNSDSTTSTASLGETTTMITSEDIHLIDTYLSSGGRFEFALDAITDDAYEKSPVGTLYRRQDYLRDEELEFQKEVADLPTCANDLDFELVREKLGLSREKIGPYWFFLTDDEDEDDDMEGGEEVLYEGVKKDDETTE